MDARGVPGGSGRGPGGVLRAKVERGSQGGGRGAPADPDYVFVVLIVDDFLICGKTAGVDLTIRGLQGEFKAKDLGEVTRYNGLSFERDRRGGVTTVHQHEYVEEIMQKFELEGLRPSRAASPLPQGLQPHKIPRREPDQDPPDCPYRSLLGSLMYLLKTRADLVAPVQGLARFAHCYTEQHWDALLHIMRYLKREPRLGLRYSVRGEHDLTLIAYTDGNNAQEGTGRSTSGSVMMLCNAAVDFRNQKQPFRTCSSTGSEIIAANATLMLVEDYRDILYELGFHQTPTVLFCDNKATITRTLYPRTGPQGRNIGARQDVLIERQKLGIIDIQYIPTAENLADPLSKSVTSGVLTALLPTITGSTK